MYKCTEPVIAVQYKLQVNRTGNLSPIEGQGILAEITSLKNSFRIGKIVFPQLEVQASRGGPGVSTNQRRVLTVLTNERRVYLKSGMPALVEIPAPHITTMFLNLPSSRPWTIAMRV